MNSGVPVKKESQKHMNFLLNVFQCSNPPVDKNRKVSGFIVNSVYKTRPQSTSVQLVIMIQRKKNS
jgi:hypothetical protein